MTGMRRQIRSIIKELRLPAAARAERHRDRAGLPIHDPGVESAIDEGVAWLGRAQDHSSSTDGGVASHYSLVGGWSPSYPETTGYIIPTILAYANLRQDESARSRAKRMLDWLITIQFANGGFQCGVIGSYPMLPVTFNTGQILLGLASGVHEFGTYREPMQRAADWLVETQDSDGCWRRYPTPHAAPGEKVYETHVAWGLLEAARLEPDKPYADAALANVQWALRWQRDNGWFDNCCIFEPERPLTHAIGYTLRGIIEAYRFTNDTCLLQAAQKTADSLLAAAGNDGFLPGRLYPDWTGAVTWACLTGSAQISWCWLSLYQCTGDIRYRNAAYAANQYVRRTMKVDGTPDMRGGIKGSFPVHGPYGAYQMLNWACKFCVDANMLELAVQEQEGDHND